MYHNMLSGGIDYETQQYIKKVRAAFMEGGGDPTKFPDYLAEHGIKAIGPFIKVDGAAKTAMAILKDV